MLEFFIAFIGGLHYGSKYANEKSKLRSVNKSQKNRADALADIQLKYAANFETEQWAKDFVSSGKHFGDICDWFADDFRYVFGDSWETKLTIPTPTLPMVRIYGKNNYPWHMPSAHVLWVYHLLLASKGKIDSKALTCGFPIGGVGEKNMTVKFTERIEKHLLESGAQGIRMALELDNLCGVRRTPSDLCGGNIKIESLCVFPTFRLWGDCAE